MQYDTATIDKLLVNIFLVSLREAPEEIVIDLDATDLPLHGRQEQRFFHGFYNHYCYLPLYIVCGDHLLGVRLRPANIDASAGSLEEIERIVAQSGRLGSIPESFCALIPASAAKRSCPVRSESSRYVFGLPAMNAYGASSTPRMQQAASIHRQTGHAARLFTEFAYQTHDSWSRPRRVVAKAEQIEAKENPRYDLARDKRLAGTEVVRRALLCTRRYGEPHQKTVLVVCRAGQHRHAACQPIAVVSVGCGLCTHVRLSPTGSFWNRVGAGAVRNHPLAVTALRRPGPHHCAQSLDIHQQQLSALAHL